MLFVIRSILTYLRPYKLLTILFLVGLLLDISFMAFSPLSFKFLIDKAIIPQSFKALYIIVGIVLGAGIISFSAGFMSDHLLSKISARVHHDLRQKLFIYLQKLPIDYYQRVRSGDIVSRFSVDLVELERTIYGILPIGLSAFLSLLTSIGILFYLEWRITLCLLVGSGLFFIGPGLLGKKAQQTNAQYKEELGNLSSFVLENVKGQKVIRGFNLQEIMIERFKKQMEFLFAINLRKNLINISLERIPLISVVLLNIIILSLGSYMTFKDYISIGTFVSYNSTFLTMSSFALTLSQIVPMFFNAATSIQRVNDILDEPVEWKEQNKVRQIENSLQDIRYENVTFGYTDDKTVLKNINATIPAGKFIAFVGPSGSGKSTMIQLLLRFYDPKSGKVSYGDMDLTDISHHSFREQFGAVFQENFLFRGSIRENIKVSDPLASDEKMIFAAKQAEVHDFINSLPEGYDTQVGDEGGNLSGGQRQRIAIARALLKDPKILLLDEATSALDPISEAAVNQTIANLAKGRTVISVTHRLASVVNMDEIFVFKNGELVEHGNHLQLLQLAGAYQELWEKQSGLSISEDGLMADINEERLVKLPFFRSLSIDIIKEIKRLFVTERYNSGHTVIEEGEHGDKFYLIVRGRVDVLKNQEDGTTIKLANLEDGDHFGEIALLKHIPRTASVKTTTASIFLTLQRNMLELLMHKYPQIKKMLEASLDQRS